MTHDHPRQAKKKKERGTVRTSTAVPLPPPEPPEDGDFFLDTDTGIIYGPRADGAWPAATARSAMTEDEQRHV